MNRLATHTAGVVVCLICESLATTSAQQSSPSSSSSGYESGGASVRGRICLPDGTLPHQTIRLQLLSEGGSRRPEYFFTDSNGQFVLYNMVPLASYVIVVEGNGGSWGTTRESFIVPNDRIPVIRIQLRSVERGRDLAGATVSAAQLRQKIPRNARKEFQNALRLIHNGQRAAAQPMLLRAVELFPDYVNARNELAVELMESNQLAEAEQQLRLALAVDTVAVRPLLNLGICLQR